MSLWEWDFATGQSLGGSSGSSGGGGGGSCSGSSGGSGGIGSLLGGGSGSGTAAVPYHLYRVYNAQDPHNARIVIIRDIVKAVTARRAKLCLAL